MSPRFNSDKSMSQIENDYLCESRLSPDDTTSSKDDLTNEGRGKTTTRTPKQKTKTKKVQLCAVCNDVAAGTYFGAAVCLPCKSFYIRCTKDDPNPKFSCAFGDNCQINKQNRLRCQSCRFKKCLEAGMHRKEKLDYVEPTDGQELCLVCGDIANGCHFGIFTCEGCKKFYRRGMHEADTYQCKADKQCVITPRTRNDCRYCRFQKCIAVGMSRQAIKMGRPKKAQRRDDVLKSEPVQVSTTVTQDIEIQMEEGGTPKLLITERKPEISSLMAGDCFAMEGSGKKILNPYGEATTAGAGRHPETSADCAGPLVAVPTLLSMSGSEIPACLPSLVEVRGSSATPPARYSSPPVVCDSSLVVDTTPDTTTPKEKEDAAGADSADLMFSNASVDVDLDNFIRTLDEQEEAILSAQVENISSTSGSEYGEIIHWLKERESASPQNFFQAIWDPIKGSPSSQAAGLASEPANHFAAEIQSADGGVQPLKPLSGSGIYQPLGGDYVTLTPQRTEQPLVLGGENVGENRVVAGVMADEPSGILGEPSNGDDVRTRPSNPGRPTTLGAPPSDIWLRHRSTESGGLSGQQDDTEMVSSTGQVKRRPFDSDLSEVAPKVFRMDYWTSQLSAEIPQFNEQHHKLLSKLQTAYEALVEHADESKMPTQKNTLHAAEETRNSLRSVTKRIIRSLSAAMNFALSIPGFKRVEQSDQFHLVKYGGFHMMIILAGREQYIPEKHTFKYFWNAAVPNSHPVYRLRQDLLEAGKAIYWLKLDQIEAAALGALALISTDWLQLNFPHRLEAINKPVLDSFLAYVIDKHGRIIGKNRVKEMFQLMPTLRELTLRHAYYMQNLQLVVDASELVKMCECISLNDRR